MKLTVSYSQWTNITEEQWWNVSKYIYLSTVLRYNFEVLYLSSSILCNFILLLHYMSDILYVTW